MAKVIYMVDGIEIVECYDGVKLTSIIIDGEEIVVGKTNNKTIKEIVDYLINNIAKIVKEGIMVIDIVNGVTNHPHYHSRYYNSIEFDEDDYGVTTIIYDSGCSGSPSAWNHYKCSSDLVGIASWIMSDFYYARVEEAQEEDRIVDFNKDLLQIYIKNEE